MSFAAGKPSFRMLRMPRLDIGTITAGLQAHPLPSMEATAKGPVTGWVTGRHAMDSALTRETLTYGGCLRASLVQAERVVPASYLKAEVRMEELAYLEATGERGTTRVSAQHRSEIHSQVLDRLRATTAPTLREIEFTMDLAYPDIAYTSAVSVSQSDALLIYMAMAGIRGIVPIQIETLCPKLRDVSPLDLAERGEQGSAPGQDFLTWLWFVAEAQGGIVILPPDRTVALMLTGPLVMAGDDDGGAKEARLSKGEPMLAPEGRAALLAGKRLRRAQVTLMRGDRGYTFTFDADDFSLRSVALPEGEKLDPVSRYQDRITAVAEVGGMMRGLANYYEARRFSAEWPETLKEMREWARTRRVRS